MAPSPSFVPLAASNDPHIVPPEHQYALLPSESNDEKDTTQRALPTTARSTSKRSAKLISAIQAACVIFFTIGAITLALSSRGIINQNDSKSFANDLDLAESHPGAPLLSVPQCAQTKPVAPVNQLDNVWSSLTLEEAVNVRAWLFDSAQELNLTHGDVALMKYVPNFPRPQILKFAANSDHYYLTATIMSS